MTAFRQHLSQQSKALRDEARIAEHAHRFSAESWSWARFLLGVPAAVLAAVSGYFALGENNLGWGGVMAVAAALLTTLLTTLKPGEEVARHQLASARFGDIRRRASALGTVDVASSANDGNLDAELDELLAAFAVAEQEAPNLTRARRVRAMRYIAGRPDEVGWVAKLLGRLLQLILVAVASAIVLLIVNWFVRDLLEQEVPGGLWGGLGFALLIYAVVFAGLFWALSRQWAEALLTGAAAAIVFVFLIPLAIATPAAGQDPVAKAASVASKLDVVVVVSPARFGPEQASIPPRVGRPPWNTRYSVGVIEESGLRWRLRDSASRDDALAAAAGDQSAAVSPPAAPQFRPDADRIVLLVPDPIPPAIESPARVPSTRGERGEVQLWLQALRTSGLAVAPTFALLATRDKARLGSWQLALKATGGGAAALQALGAQALTDAAELLASESQSSRSDFALAFRHRPRLLFSNLERSDNWPLNIDNFFRRGLVRMCTVTSTGLDDCPVVANAAALRNGGTHLRIDLQRPQLGAVADDLRAPPAPPGAAPPSAPPPAPPAAAEMPPPPTVPPPGEAESAIYVHVTRDEEQRRIHLDYWWYLPYNPSIGLDGAFCGPGFTIAGLTCFDHQSDWEGVVVTLDDSTEPPTPLIVGYAQHERVVAYSWTLLKQRWRLTAGDQRPRVYVARNSHASYPFRCAPPADPPCRQTVDPRPEGRHDGGRLWPYNDDAECTEINCLLTFPTRDQGRRPALWNAYEGSWGEQRCILRVYCDIGAAPRAPAHHHRYRDPARADRRVGSGSAPSSRGPR